MTIIHSNWAFRSRPPRALLLALNSVAGAIVLLGIVGCTPVIENPEEADAVLKDASILADCGKEILGKDFLRIRNSQLRMELADDGEYLANHLVDYAVMAAAAYDYPDNPDRGSCKDTLRPDDKWMKHLINIAKWHEKTVGIFGKEDLCEEDNNGFYARVWERSIPHDGDRREVVIAFRGTKGIDDWDDWVYGNLYWFLGSFTPNDQYDKTPEFLDRVLDYYKKKNIPILVRTVGHSLGGGLAQHALYARPKAVSQVFAFHSSLPTGYHLYDDENRDASKRRRRASCEAATDFPDEARIYRIYESHEVLAYPRFASKMLIPLSRHINEIRTNFDQGWFVRQHSIESMADKLIKKADNSVSKRTNTDWLSSDPPFCRSVFRKSQESNYNLPNDRELCPNKP